MSVGNVQIQVRLGSTRLPGKVLYPLGEKQVVDWVHTRAAAATPGSVAVAIGDRPENDAIVEWCKRNGVNWIAGPEDDLLERHLLAASEFGSDPVVRVTGDCPFVPPEEIERVIGEHETNDAVYTTNVTDGMPIGTAVDVIDRDVLEELRDLGESHPVKRLREETDRWTVAFTENERWSRFADAHVAVDTPADYWTLTDALDAVGSDPLDVVRWVSQR